MLVHTISRSAEHRHRCRSERCRDLPPCPSLFLCPLPVETVHLTCRMVPLVSPQLAAFRDRPPSLPCSRWVLGYPPLQDRIGQALFMPCGLSDLAIIYGLLKEYRETVRWGICPYGDRSAFYWQQASLDVGQSMHVHHLPIFLYSLFS